MWNLIVVGWLGLQLCQYSIALVESGVVTGCVVPRRIQIRNEMCSSARKKVVSVCDIKHSFNWRKNYANSDCMISVFTARHNLNVIASTRCFRSYRVNCHCSPRSLLPLRVPLASAYTFVQRLIAYTLTFGGGWWPSSTNTYKLRLFRLYGVVHARVLVYVCALYCCSCRPVSVCLPIPIAIAVGLDCLCLFSHPTSQRSGSSSLQGLNEHRYTTALHYCADMLCRSHIIV